MEIFYFCKKRERVKQENTIRYSMRQQKPLLFYKAVAPWNYRAKTRKTDMWLETKIKPNRNIEDEFNNHSSIVYEVYANRTNLVIWKF